MEDEYVEFRQFIEYEDADLGTFDVIRGTKGLIMGNDDRLDNHGNKTVMRLVLIPNYVNGRDIIVKVSPIHLLPIKEPADFRAPKREALRNEGSEDLSQKEQTAKPDRSAYTQMICLCCNQVFEDQVTTHCNLDGTQLIPFGHDEMLDRILKDEHGHEFQLNKRLGRGKFSDVTPQLDCRTKTNSR